MNMKRIVINRLEGGYPITPTIVYESYDDMRCIGFSWLLWNISFRIWRKK